MRNDNYDGMIRVHIWMPEELAERWKNHCRTIRPRLSIQDDGAGMALLAPYLSDRIHHLLSAVALGKIPIETVQPFLDAIEAAGRDSLPPLAPVPARPPARTGAKRGTKHTGK